LCGGQPYIARQDQSAQPGTDPFPYRLEPLSLDSLAKYAVCEMPAESAIPSGMEQFVSEIRARAEGTLGATIHRVGALYAKIYWLFMPDDHAVGPWTDFPAELFAAEEPGRHIAEFAEDSAAGFQADGAEWQIGGGDILVDECLDRDTALAALHRLTAQGEGLSSTADSHFELFLRAYARAKAAGVEVHPVPVDPTTDSGARPGTSITHPVSARLSRLCDATYALLLTEVLLSLRLDKRGEENAVRQELILASLGGMRDVRWQANQLVTRLPLDAAAGATRRAAPAFMPPGTVGGDRATLKEAYARAIAAFEAEVENLAAEPGLDALIEARLPAFRARAAEKRALSARI
jgi:hypothetical protein